MVVRFDRRGLGGGMVARVCIAMMLLCATAGAQSDEAAARQLFQNGQSLLGRHQYTDAIAAFNSVLTTAPRSAVADDALYEIARYQLEILADPRTADASADRLLKDYADSDSAPRARVLKGRVALATAATPEQLNAAVATFDRLAESSGDSPAAAEALYYAADAMRLAGRRDEALGRFDEVSRRYASSPVAPRALLASAPLLVAGGQAVRALEVLQRVRNRFPTAPEAAAAGDSITLLYRFYIRAPAQPPYAYSGSMPAGDMKIRDFRDLDVGAGNHLFVVTKSTLVEFGAKGEVLSSTDAPNSHGVIIDREGRPITITDEGGLRMAGQPLLSLTTTRQDGRLEPVHLDAGVVTSSGNMIVTNRDKKTVVQFSSDGKPKGDFARMIAAKRLAVDGQDQVAALDADSKSVVVFGRDGHIVTRIPERGTGYQFKQPVDIAFDRLGHLYVLDRAAVFVFTPQNTLLTTISIPEKTPGSFANAEALALDSAARLFVFDSRAALVQVYR